MAPTARNARLVAIVIGTAAAALAPAAAASSNGATAPREQLYVNPSTGFATPVARETVRVNPSTGYASVTERSTSELVPAVRSTQPTVAAEASSGFDLASAGIGAAAGAALTLLVMASLAKIGVGMLRRTRPA